MVTPHVSPADDYPRQADGVSAPSGEEVGLDYGEVARRAALEDGSGVGQLAARLQVQREEYHSPHRPSNAAPEQLELPIPPKRRRQQYTGGRSLVDGPSGRDVSRMLAEADPGPDMTPEERRAAAAKGVQLARQLLAAVKPQQKEVAAAKPVWLAPRGTDRRLQSIKNDRRAGFLPATMGELSFAEELHDRLSPTTDKNSVDSYLATQKSTFMRLPGMKDLADEEKSAKADDAMQNRLHKFGDYTADAAHKMIALKQLAGVVYEADPGRPLGSLLAGADDRIRAGLLTIVQHGIVREVSLDNQSSTGVDPFLNLGAKFDEVASRIGTNERLSANKIDTVINYVNETLATMTVADARNTLQTARLVETRRYNFWRRILSSVQGQYHDTAQDILSNVWQM